MFFPERIKNVLPHERVLEIGPGATPHPRSDVFLEKTYSTPAEYQSQIGTQQKLITEVPIVYYEGHRFPFKDAEFDYVICAHVLEHVDDLPTFLAEVYRVAKKGYFEYPLIYYEYLYNFNVHLNYLKFDGEFLRWMKKKDSPLDTFKPVQKFFYDTLSKGHVATLNELIPLVMEGFEWDAPPKIKTAVTLQELCHESFEVPVFDKKMFFLKAIKRFLGRRLRIS